MHPSDLLLNDYADEGLSPDDRRGVDEHLGGCERCRALVAEVREIRRAAKNLRPMEPPARTWARIAEAIQQSSLDGPAEAGHHVRAARAGRHVRGTWLGLAAAAVFVLATVVGVRFMNGRGASQPDEPTATAPSAQSVEAELRQAEEHYQKAISGLEQIANADKGVLDPKTAATLQKNLAVVDQAITESRAALRSRPDSEPAQTSLLESFRAKIALLQNTVALINEMRKGDPAGAAQVISGLRKGA